LKAVLNQKQYPEPDFAQPSDLGQSLKDILVPGMSAVKNGLSGSTTTKYKGDGDQTVVGITSEGPGDATVIKPVFNSIRRHRRERH